MGESAATPGEGTSRVRVGAISLDVPDRLVATADAPVDAAAVVLTGTGLTVIIDQSPFADRLERARGLPDLREEAADIVGATGRTVTFRTPADRTYTVATVLSTPARVTVVVRADDTVPEAEARRIVESLRVLGPIERTDGGSQHE